MFIRRIAADQVKQSFPNDQAVLFIDHVIDPMSAFILWECNHPY